MHRCTSKSYPETSSLVFPDTTETEKCYLKSCSSLSEHKIELKWNLTKANLFGTKRRNTERRAPSLARSN